MANLKEVDWAGLVQKTVNTAIDIIARKVEGVEAKAQVGVTPTGLYFSKALLSAALVGTAIVGIVIILKKL